MKKDLQIMMRAEEHDARLALAVSTLSESVVEIGKELAIMRDDQLWRFVRDPNGKGVFTTWRDYARYRLGRMSTSRMYEFLSAESLMHGAKPMPAAEIERLGVKKAAQIARLPEKKRTKKLLRQVEEVSVQATKTLVDSLIGEDGPTVKLVPFSISLPQEVVDLIIEIEHDGQFLESVRDSDRSWSLRSKFWHQVFSDFRDHNLEDLRAAAMYREMYFAQKKSNSEAVETQSVN